MLRSGIKLTTCDQNGVTLRGFPLKESSTLSLSASSIWRKIPQLIAVGPVYRR
jgi:hypothetical protein